MLRQFDLAKQTCDVCVFTITDDRITDAIIRAHARGVNVRVITDDEKSHDLGSDMDKLRASGIPCKMDMGNVAHMHHKFALFDGRRLMTGSFNWTRSASEQNEENLIVTPDPVLVSLFAGRFEYLWGRMKETAVPSPWAPTTDLPGEGPMTPDLFDFRLDLPLTDPRHPFHLHHMETGTGGGGHRGG